MISDSLLDEIDSLVQTKPKKKGISDATLREIENIAGRLYTKPTAQKPIEKKEEVKQANNPNILNQENFTPRGQEPVNIPQIPTNGNDVLSKVQSLYAPDFMNPPTTKTPTLKDATDLIPTITVKQQTYQNKINEIATLKKQHDDLLNSQQYDAANKLVPTFNKKITELKTTAKDYDNSLTEYNTKLDAVTKPLIDNLISKGLNKDVARKVVMDNLYKLEQQPPQEQPQKPGHPGIPAEGFLKLLGLGLEAVPEGLMSAGKLGLEGIKERGQGIKEVLGLNKPFISEANLPEGATPTKEGLNKILSGTLKTGLSGVEGFIQTQPAVIGYTIAQPILTQIGKGIGGKTGEEVVNTLSPFLFGPAVGIGSLMSKGADWVVDNSGVFDKLSPEKKELYKKMLNQVAFFTGLALGGKAINKVGDIAGKELPKYISPQAPLKEFTGTDRGLTPEGEALLSQVKKMPEGAEKTAYENGLRKRFAKEGLNFDELYNTESGITELNKIVKQIGDKNAIPEQGTNESSIRRVSGAGNEIQGQEMGGRNTQPERITGTQDLGKGTNEEEITANKGQVTAFENAYGNKIENVPKEYVQNFYDSMKEIADNPKDYDAEDLKLANAVISEIENSGKPEQVRETAPKPNETPIVENKPEIPETTTQQPQKPEVAQLPVSTKEVWYRGVNKNNEASGDKFYSQSPDVAGDYAINKVGETPKQEQLKELPKNPLKVNDKNELADLIGYKGDPLAEPINAKVKFDDLAKKYAQENGYDAIEYTEGTFGEPELHTFAKQPTDVPLKTEPKKEDLRKQQIELKDQESNWWKNRIASLNKPDSYFRENWKEWTAQRKEIAKEPEIVGITDKLKDVDSKLGEIYKQEKNVEKEKVLQKNNVDDLVQEYFTTKKSNLYRGVNAGDISKFLDSKNVDYSLIQDEWNTAYKKAVDSGNIKESTGRVGKIAKWIDKPTPQETEVKAGVRPVEGIEYAKRPDGTLKTKSEYTPEEWAKYTKSVIDKKLTEEQPTSLISEPEKETTFAETKNVPIRNIKTDEGRFQNRADAFSEETASSIEKNFNPIDFKPITLWKDPKDGNDYVLAGHSRLEGMKRRGVKEIPSQYFEGTEDEAINYARIESNRKSTSEDLLADVKAYKRAKEQNYSKAKLLETFKKESKVKTLDNFSNLDENGEFLRAINSDAAKSFPYIERNSSWVGELRKTYPQLTDAHEKELFDYFYRGKEKNSFIKKEDLFNKVEDRVGDITFKPEQNLALDKLESTGSRARSDTRDIQNKVDSIKARNRELVSLSKGAPETQKNIFQKEILDNTEQIQKLEGDIGEIINSQIDIFSQLENEVKNEAIDEDTAKEIITTADPTELRELAKDIERQEKSPEDFRDEEIQSTINRAEEVIKPKKPSFLKPPKGSNAVIVKFKDGKQSKLPIKDIDVIGKDFSKVESLSYGVVDFNKTGGLKWDTFKEISKVNPNEQILKQDLLSDRSELQQLQDYKKHLELSIPELEKQYAKFWEEDGGIGARLKWINSLDYSRTKQVNDFRDKLEYNGDAIGMKLVEAKSELYKTNEKLQKLWKDIKKKEQIKGQEDIFASDEINIPEEFQNELDLEETPKKAEDQLQLFQIKEHNRILTVYNKMSAKEQERFLDELAKGGIKEILQGNLTKERAAAVIKLLKSSVTFDPRTSNITTAWEESLHNSVVALAKPYLAQNLLKENGWNGKGEIWDVDGNESLRNAHENLAKKYIDWRTKQEKNPSEPKTRLEKFFQMLRELWAKISSYLNRIGFKTQAGYFYDLATGKLRKNVKINDVDVNTELALTQKVEQTNSPEFKEWFGKSKVIDGYKNPLIVYHGTTGNFNTFEKGDVGFHFGSSEQADTRTLPIVKAGRKPFTRNEVENGINKIVQVTSEGANIIPVYLRLENPLRVRDNALTSPKDYANAIIEEANKGNIDNKIATYLYANVEKMLGPNYSLGGKNTQKAFDLIRGTLKQYGYDGLVYQNEYEDKEVKSDSYVVFDKNQIKSAIGNEGTFNLIDPNILKQKLEKINPELTQALFQKLPEKQGEMFDKPELQNYLDRIAKISNPFELNNWKKKHYDEIMDMPSWERDEVIDKWNDKAKEIKDSYTPKKVDEDIKNQSSFNFPNIELWSKSHEGKKVENKYEGSDKPYLKYLEEAGKIWDSGKNKFKTFTEGLNQSDIKLSPSEKLKLYQEIRKRKVKEHNKGVSESKKGIEEQETMIVPKPDIIDKENEQIKQSIKDQLYKSDLPKDEQTRFINFLDKELDNYSETPRRKWVALNIMAERYGQITKLYGKAGGEIANLFAEGNVKEVKIGESAYHFIESAEEIYDKIAKEKYGIDKTIEYDKKIKQALENREDAEKILGNDEQLKQIYQNVKGFFDYYRDLENKAGIPTLDNYYPRKKMMDEISRFLTEVPEDIKSDTKGLNQFIAVNSPYFEHRIGGGEVGNENILDMMKSYNRSVSRTLAYKDAVNYYTTDFKKDIPLSKKSQSLKPMYNFIVANLTPDKLYMPWLSWIRNNMYMNQLSFNVKASTQNWGQKMLADAYASKEAIDLTSKFVFDSAKNLKGNLRKAYEEIKYLEPDISRSAKIGEYDPQKGLAKSITEKVNKIDTFSISEKTNWSYSELLGIKNSVIGTKEYKGWKEANPKATDEQKLDKIEELLGNPKIFKSAIREGRDLAANTQISPTATYRPEIFEKEWFRKTIGMYRRFPVAIIEHTAKSLFGKLEGADGLYAQRILRRGVTAEAELVDKLDAFEYFRKKAERYLDELKTGKRKSNSAEEQFTQSLIDHWKKIEDNINKELKSNVNIGGRWTRIRKFMKLYGYGVFITSLFQVLYNYSDNFYKGLFNSSDDKKNLAKWNEMTETQQRELIESMAIKSMFDAAPLPFYGGNISQLFVSPVLPNLEWMKYGKFNPKGVARTGISYVMNIIPGLGLVDRILGRSINNKLTNVIFPQKEKSGQQKNNPFFSVPDPGRDILKEVQDAVKVK